MTKRTCPDCNGDGIITVDGHREACGRCGGLNNSTARGFNSIHMIGTGEVPEENEDA